MPRDSIIEAVKERFRDAEFFSRDELYSLLREFSPFLNESTFRWRVYDLKAKKIIRSVSKSEFSLAYRPPFKPRELDKKLRDLYSAADEQYPSLKKAIWSTQWLTEFMLHIPSRSWIIFEVEKDSLESVFYFLKDIKYKEVFLRPEEHEIDRYVSESNNPIIVKPLVTLSPLQKVKNVSIPKIEKILLDIFVDTELFGAFQGKELSRIFNNAYHLYAIDFSKMIAYAKRRGKDEELMEFISNRTDVPNTLFND
jgi:hypothetical protein